MIISFNTLLPSDNPLAVAVAIGITIKPVPVGLNVIELDVVAIKTKVTNDLILFLVFYICYISFLICCFYL